MTIYVSEQLKVGTLPSTGELEQAFIDFLNGDRSTKLYNFSYYADLSKTSASQNSGVESWNKILSRKSDYYIFPNEVEVIERSVKDMAGLLIGSPNLIELGTGSAKSVEQKTLPFLRALKPSRYIANDLSLKSVTIAENIVRQHMPQVLTETCQADFLDEKSAIYGYPSANVILTGSTISNITAYNGHPPVNEVVAYLKKIGKLLGKSGHLLITQDTNQDEQSLKAAYNCPEFVQFRKDALCRLKEYLGLDSFDPTAFEYEPVWEEESHLLTTTFVSTRAQMVKVGDKVVYIPKGRRIYASNCYKYPAQAFLHMSRIAGLRPVKTWMDGQGRVALHVLRT